jgi:hypothetical protein
VARGHERGGRRREAGGEGGGAAVGRVAHDGGGRGAGEDQRTG